MKDSDWKQILYFRKSEAWGDPSLISPDLMRCLDNYRSYIKTPIIITCGTQGVHVEHSNHNKGTAIDCVIPDYDLVDALFDALRFPFTGIGLYPSWQYLGKTIGGIHLEYAPSTNPKALWMGIGPSSEQTYIALNHSNLKKYIDNR